MQGGGQSWAIVLAAGEGTRLQALTTTSAGVAIPKQFCSLRGGASLLHEAQQRAERVCGRERIVTVVAADHRRWWQPALAWLPRRNVIVQPRNCGTGNGILLPLLHILQRDPEARILLLPSDHYVRDERTLGRALERAVRRVADHPWRAILLGVEPEDVDTGLGYIVPGREDGCGVRTVLRFVEKPTAAAARTLIADGALWNAFIVAARGQALLDLFRRRFPQVVTALQRAVARDTGHPAEPSAVPRVYEALPAIDFSRQVAQGAESALRVMAVPACGWSDLGTPSRLAQTLACLSVQEGPGTDARLVPWCGQLNLAVQHARAAAA